MEVRLFVGRKYLRKSTKCENKREAIKFAKQFYDQVKIAERLDLDIHRGVCQSFDEAAGGTRQSRRAR